MRPDKSAVIACGANNNAAKVFSVESGARLLSVSDIDPIIAQNPLVVVDTHPQGTTVCIGSANGNIHVKNIAIAHEEIRIEGTGGAHQSEDEVTDKLVS
jgi:hypothetical protein